MSTERQATDRQPTDRQPTDHQARAAAVDPSRSFLVQAPAGSGKTELLTDRILALLAIVDSPEELVAITFTRKAAAEMHARVMQKLAAGLGPAPEREQARRSHALAVKALARDAERGWHLLEHPARLAIQTIDSFCASLVRRMPYLSQLGGMPKTIDDARPHYLDAARATIALADHETLGAPVRLLLEHLDVDLGATEALIANMLASRDQWLPLIIGAGEGREALEGHFYDAVCDGLEGLIAAMPLGWSHTLAPVARAAAECLEADKPGVLTALLHWDGPLSASPDALPQWRALSTFLLTSGKLRKPGGINKNLGFPVGCAHKADMVEWLSGADESAAWIARLNGVNALPVPEFDDAQWRVVEALLFTLRLAAAQLMLVFAEKGEADFSEIAQRAVSALGEVDDPSELLLKLDNRIRHLLLDEFQDTSLPQIRLLEKLTAGWGQNAGVGGDGRTLFLVGDPMQSIYRFRKADVGLFLSARDHGIGEIRPQFLQLTDNFRSQAGIVDWVNRAFAMLFPREDRADDSAIAYAKSIAFNPAHDGAAVTFHPVWKAKGSEPAVSEAEHVIDLIEREIAAGAQTIAVLVRAKSHAKVIARQLGNAGIAHRAVELTPLAQRPVVADLVQLTRSLLHPGDRLAWLATLRAPWIGLRLESMAALFAGDQQSTVPVLLGNAERRAGLADDERARADFAASVLLEPLPSALPLAAAIAGVWRALGGDRVYPGVRDGFDAESFFQLLERIAPYGALDPAELDDALAKLFASPDPGEARVEIMTIHKSKGLQFDVVIVPGLHRKAPPDHAPLLRFEQTGGRLLLGPIKRLADADADPLSKYLGERDKRRAAYEVDRLLYVAATRAKHRLHWVAEMAVDLDKGEAVKPQASSLLARLLPIFGTPVLPALERGESEAASNAIIGPPFKRVPTAALPAVAEAGAKLANQPTPKLDDAGIDAAIGTLAHAWLERIGRDGIAAWPADRLAGSVFQISRQLRRAGVAETRIESATQTVLDTLQATISDETGQWLLSQPARREWRLIAADGSLSVIDLAIETSEGVVIVDYKTAIPHDGETVDAFLERESRIYAPQLARYREQVSALDGRNAQTWLYFPRVGRVVKDVAERAT
ncbi:nuclease/helicase [Jeongeupia sp. HS-3]|uniref:UvrD-helicase domain-containing protein n=1 Tax=Jeongeupia sp. HS-3 TaxID=1009682 RepID=UPI0018A466F7|nr:UvrD-helicase domain-containing protein [Jeongeupia sp. HS-3]BCL74997.1 nuclease/helicase [Jeongeupia sp. HS-3]